MIELASLTDILLFVLIGLVIAAHLLAWFKIIHILDELRARRAGTASFEVDTRGAQHRLATIIQDLQIRTTRIERHIGLEVEEETPPHGTKVPGSG